MRNALLVLWIATLGADRVDFFAGSGPFLLTPFLVLTPLVVVVELVSLFARRRALRLPRGSIAYALIASIFLALALFSVMWSLDVLLSAKRFVFLLFQIYSTFFIALAIANREDARRILVTGAFAGLAIFYAIDIAQVIIFATGGAAVGIPEGKILFLAPWVYGSWMPRLSGPTVDVNRGGLLLLTYLFILVRFATSSRTRSAFLAFGAVAVLATLSRSTVLALTVAGILFLLQRRLIVTSPKRVFSAGMIGAAGVAAVMALFEMFRSVLGVISPAIILRLTGDESSSIHFDLLRYGFEVGTSSLQNALFGVGFGSSYALLEEFFPGDTYANFHSLYISLWVEMGVVALGLGLVMLIYPFLRSGTYRPLLGGILVFNIFYQTTLEPVFWFVLVAAWIGLGNPDVMIQRLPSMTTSPFRRLGAATASLLMLLTSGCSDLLPPSYEYGSVAVETVRRNGEPVDSVNLVLYTGEQHMAYAMTGSDGSHIFDLVPFGRYGVGAIPPPGYVFPQHTPNFQHEIKITEGADTTITFVLLKMGDGTVRAQVVGPGDRPMSGVPLTLYTSQAVVETGVTNADGLYTFPPVPLGEYGVSMAPIVGYVPIEKFYVDGIIVDEGSEETITLALEVCEGIVRVQTTDLSGNPVAGTALRLYTSREQVAVSSTNGGGVHEFTGVGCGVQYGVQASPPAGYVVPAGERNYVDGIEITQGEEEVVEFRFERCFGSLRVAVVDGAGAPVPGAMLTVYTSTEAITTGETDEQGIYTFTELACRQYGVSVVPPAGYSVEPGRGTSFVDGIDIENAVQDTAQLVVVKN